MVIRSILLGILTSFLGAVIAFGYLLDDTPKVISPKDLAEAEGDAENLFEEGPRLVVIYPMSEVSSPDLQSKRAALASGNAATLTFSEGEVNAWIQSNFTPAEPEDEVEKALTIRPTVPRVALLDGRVQMAMHLDAEAMDKRMRIAVVGEGAFQPGSDGPEFKFDSLSFSQGRIPLAQGVVVSVLLSAFEQAPEWEMIKAAWPRVQSVELREGEIVLNLQ